MTNHVKTWLENAIYHYPEKMQQALVVAGPRQSGKSTFAKLLEECVQRSNVEFVKEAITADFLTFHAKACDFPIHFENRARVLILSTDIWQEDRRFLVTTPFEALAALSEI